ncbi:MAG: hypothetical protein ACLUVC_04905 [Longibaculum sp.]
MNVKYEFLKLKKYKIIIVFICFLSLLKIFELSQYSYQSVFINPHSETYYQEYIDKYKGTLDQQSLINIENEKTAFETANEQRQTIMAQSQKFEYSQNTNIIEVKDELEKNLNYLDHKEAFDYFYNQVEYVKEHSQYMIFDYRGWQNVLEDEYVDIILVVLLIMINGFIFVVDYDEGTYSLIATTSRGRKGSLKEKIKLSIIMSITIILGLQLLHDMYYILNYSFDYSYAQIQNIPLFTNAPYHLSLLQSVIIVRLIRFLGYFMVVVFSWILIIIFKHLLTASFIQIGIYILLKALLSHEYLYLVISPLSLIMGSGYFRGNEYRILNRNTDGAIEIQTYFMNHHTLMWVGMFLLIGCIGYLLIRCYRQYTLQKTQKRHLGIFMCMIVLLLTGCQSSQINYGHVYQHQNYIENQNAIVFRDNNGHLKYYDQSFQSFEYIKDPQFILEGNIIDFYQDNQFIYFLVAQGDNNYQFYSYDDNKRECSLIYEKKQETYQNFNFFQEDYSFFEQTNSVGMIRQFYLYDNELFYCDDKYVYKENMKTHHNQALVQYSNNQIGFIKNKMYFCDKRKDLICYDLITNQKDIISNDFIYEILQYKDKIYFTQAKQSGIYQYDGEKIIKILDDVYEIYAANEYMLYYHDNQILYIYNMKTKETKKIEDRNIYSIFIINDQRIIAIEGNGDDVDILKTDILFDNIEKINR